MKRNKSTKKIKKVSSKKFFNKIFLFITIVLCIIIIGTVIIDLYVSNTGRKLTKEIKELSGEFDCIIVPGAFVIANSIPSDILRDRLDVAYDVYTKMKIKRIIVSGDHGTEFYDEVNVMRNYLIKKGIPGEDVFMDHAGFDTYQTIYRARDIFEVNRAVIVTQDFHLYRALYIGKKLGLELFGVDSAIREYKYEKRNRLREFPARVKAFIECEITKPLPKFLGDLIPIHGENLTID